MTDEIIIFSTFEGENVYPLTEIQEIVKKKESGELSQEEYEKKYIIKREQIEKKIDFNKKGEYISFIIDLDSGKKGSRWKVSDVKKINDIFLIISDYKFHSEYFNYHKFYNPIEMMINTALKENPKMTAEEICDRITIEIED